MKRNDPRSSAAAACTGILAALVFLFPREATSSPPYQAMVSAEYSTDSATRLFENYEDTHQADSASATVTYGPGYLGGKAVRLPDTGAHLVYSESWWVRDANDMQDSGTMECFVKVEEFRVSGGQFYPLLLTEKQRALFPDIDGRPEFGFMSSSPYFSISDAPAGYNEIDDSASRNPGQWYHFAATWGPSGKRLYVNGVLVKSAGLETSVFGETFFVGSPPSSPFQSGLAMVGWIDRFRLSTGERTVFPQALDVLIDTPSPGVPGPPPDTLAQPFDVTYRAFASDSRARTVEIYADTDGIAPFSFLLASSLAESGTVSVGGGIPEDTYYIVAVAYAGDDTAFFVTKNPSWVLGAGEGAGGGISFIGGGSSACLLTRFCSGVCGKTIVGWLETTRDVLSSGSLFRCVFSIYYGNV